MMWILYVTVIRLLYTGALSLASLLKQLTNSDFRINDAFIIHSIKMRNHHFLLSMNNLEDPGI